MHITFTLRKDELNMDFIKGLKKMFSGKTLNITVSDNKDEIDETEYLLSNPVNKQMLLDGIAAIDRGEVSASK